MKPLHLVMGIGLLVSAWFAAFGDKTPSAQIAALPSRGEQGTDQRPAQQTRKRATGNTAAGTILALKPRAELIGEEATAGAGDLFGRQAWGAPAALSTVAPAPVAAPAAAAPILTYVGKKQEDGIWEVYLAQQDQLFIAREKTVIDGKYRVDAIAPPKLMLTYLPTAQRQTVMIGEAQ